jgi:flagellar hook-basal body complex protein FliE
MDVRSVQQAVPFGATTAPAPAGGADGGFGKALVDAVERLDQVQHEADNQSLQLAAGMPVDLHDVMIAQDRAALSMDLAIQVRNKLVESYHEIMRMQM